MYFAFYFCEYLLRCNGFMITTIPQGGIFVSIENLSACMLLKTLHYFACRFLHIFFILHIRK